MSARFRARAPGPVSGRLCRARRGEPGRTARISRCLSAAGIRFLGILSRPGLPPLLRSAYRAAGGGADPSGVSMFRTCETRPGPGALYTPGTAVPHGHVCIPRPPPAALQRPVPVTPVSRPVPGCLSHEASARVHWRSPLPAIPLACGSQTEREPSGFPPGFTPGRAGLGRACRGGDRPQALTWNNAVAISDLLRRIHSPRATSRRNALARCPLSWTAEA